MVVALRISKKISNEYLVISIYLRYTYSNHLVMNPSTFSKSFQSRNRRRGDTVFSEQLPMLPFQPYPSA